jgi:hypothetical protein
MQIPTTLTVLDLDSFVQFEKLKSLKLFLWKPSWCHAS